MTPFDSCIAALQQSGPTDAIFKAVDKALAEVVGHKLFTLLYVAPNGKRVKRHVQQHAQGISGRRLQGDQGDRLAQAGPRPEEAPGSATTRRTSNGPSSITS